MRPVVWSVDGYRDALEILRNIADDNPATAERVVEAIEVSGDRLGKVPTGRPGRDAGTWEKSLDLLPYVIA